MNDTSAGSDGTSGSDGLPRWSETNTRALLASIVQSSDDAIVSKDLNGIVTSWNAGAERIFGYTAGEMVGRPITIIIPEGREGEEASILARIRRGERVDHYDTVRRRKSGELISISLTVSPVHGADGKIVGASKIARDITERKRLQEAQRVLSLEVNHRSKNLLAVVEAIVRQTVAHTSPQDFVRRISQRLRALAANQDLLVDGSWRGAEIGALVRAQLTHIDGLIGSRVRLEGDRLVVTPTAAQALGMAFHELATNALKYGALSDEQGEVVVEWRIEAVGEEPELIVAWREIGGPAVVTPGRAGFGTTIIERVTGQSLGGAVVMTYAPAGLTWELRAPAGPILSVVQTLAVAPEANEISGK
jgi:PAS domain S-box-containing protein